MTSMVGWMVTICASVCGLVLTAAARPLDPKMGWMHLVIAAAVSVFFALTAIRASRGMINAGASRSEVASNNARYMGLVWAWGALALVATYGTRIQSWKEWLTFFVAFMLGAGLSLFFSTTLKKDADNGTPDDTMLNAAYYLAMVQLVGMVAVILGLLIDGKMTRFLVEQKAPWQDWAANNIFFFGAVALAAISGYALKTHSGREA